MIIASVIWDLLYMLIISKEKWPIKIQKSLAHLQLQLMVIVMIKFHQNLCGRVRVHDESVYPDKECGKVFVNDNNVFDFDN